MDHTGCFAVVHGSAAPRTFGRPTASATPRTFAATNAWASGWLRWRRLNEPSSHRAAGPGSWINPENLATPPGPTGPPHAQSKAEAPRPLARTRETRASSTFRASSIRPSLARLVPTGVCWARVSRDGQDYPHTLADGSVPTALADEVERVGLEVGGLAVGPEA
jgi:hypothetical protein